MNFRNLKIGQKLTIVFALLLSLFTATSIYQIITLNHLSILQDEESRRANDAVIISEAISMPYKLYAVFSDATINRDLEANAADWAELTLEMKRDMDSLQMIVDTEQEKVWLINARKLADDLLKNYDVLVNLLQTENQEEAIRALDEIVDKQRGEYVGYVTNIYHSLMGEMREADAIFDAEARQSQIVTLVMLFLLVALAITLTIFIVNSISKPLREGVRYVGEIAKGNLTATISINQKDEVGELVESMRAMSDNLKNIVGDIQRGAMNIAVASETINSASQQLSSGAQQMNDNSQVVSQGATEQASSVEEISASMEEMVANIQQNTDNARHSEKIALKVNEDIQKVNSKSRESVEQINRIAEKISIISDIAFQTNILALNAAVEAARAGEHGRGFAVVAAEVRKLAERSKVAADEINDLSRRSVSVTKEAGALIEGIIPDIINTSKLVQEIAAASIEQTSGVEQINNSVQQLNQVTQSNASSAEEMSSNAEEFSATAEEMSNNAEELAIQADNLRDAINFFTTGETYEADIQTSARPTNEKREGPTFRSRPLASPRMEKKKPLRNSPVKTSGINLVMGHEKPDDDFERF